MATKLVRMVTYFYRLLTIKSFCTLITWIYKVTWLLCGYGDKLGRMITHFDEFLPIKLHHPLIMWSCKIT